MARQVDEKKSEAILDAAAALFADKGLQAKMEEIARLAGCRTDGLQPLRLQAGDRRGPGQSGWRTWSRR